MGVKVFTELVCWQLCRSLKQQVYAITSTAPACNDQDFREQIRRFASSACRNIAEGFGRFGHREMSQYLKIALGSLAETQDALIDARDRAYLSAPEFEATWNLSVRAVKTTKAFKRSVDNSSDRRKPPLTRASQTSAPMDEHQH